MRLWHWVNALAITVLAITGYFIGSPLATQPGEASANYLMGYIRFAHFAAGYVLAVGLLGRIYWAIVGNAHARELFALPLLSRAYWREVGTMLKWYAFLVPQPNQYVGHNPLARLSMVFGFAKQSGGGVAIEVGRGGVVGVAVAHVELVCHLVDDDVVAIAPA